MPNSLWVNRMMGNTLKLGIMKETHIMIEKIMFFFKALYNDNANISLLTRDESNALKGLLISLIVLGHNTYLMKDMYCFIFLYSFHVYSFYFLPFLYNNKHETLGKVLIKNFKRLYVPYTFFFFVLVGIIIMQNKEINVWKLFIGYIGCGRTALRLALNTGGFLWFIPTLFSLLFFRWLYYSKQKIRLLLLCISGICLFGFAFDKLMFLQVLPSNAFVGLAMLLPAVISRYLIQRVNVKHIGLLFFSLIIVIMIIYPIRTEHFYIYRIINRLLLPIVVFLFLLLIRDCYSKNKLLIDIGKHSFQIYLYHIFIYNGLYMLFDKFNINVTLYGGLFLYIFVLFVTYSISKLRLFNIVFPK